MKITRLSIPDVVLVEPRVFYDDRGFFLEVLNQKKFCQAIGVDFNFVQSNRSRSAKNVLRGLHYQLPPQPQGKLVCVLKGAIFDVAVDIRKSSPTFGHWVGVTLTEEQHNQLWVPPGFAHGFLSLTESADVMYYTTESYAPDLERCIIWNDPSIGIQWPTDEMPLLAPKDLLGHTLMDADCFL